MGAVGHEPLPRAPAASRPSHERPGGRVPRPCRLATGQEGRVARIVDDTGLIAIGVDRSVWLDARGEDGPGQRVGPVQRAGVHVPVRRPVEPFRPVLPVANAGFGQRAARPPAARAGVGAVAVVALVVHGPAGPHGGVGAPAEFPLRTCALGRHSWLPTHRRPVASAHFPSLCGPSERMWTDAAGPRPPPRRNPAHDPARNRRDRHPGDSRATAPPPHTFGPQGPTLGDLIDAYLQDYHVRQFRSHSTARGRVAHLTAFFGRAARAAALTTHQIRQYQLARRAAGAATGTINRETSALHRMGTLAVHWGWLDTVPGFPDRLRENPPRQGFFEHPEYLAVRAHLPAPWQDILDVAYYSGWRKQEILGLTWEEIDEAGGVIRLSPARSKTLVGRMLPISQPIAEALVRRRARRDPDSPLVFHRDGITIRRWRTAWRTACQAAGVPTRFLHDCRRTAARNLIRASVPERVAMLLTGHKSRAIFDRYNIIHEQELLDAGDQLVAYLAQQAQAVPARQRPHTAGPSGPFAPQFQHWPNWPSLTSWQLGHVPAVVLQLWPAAAGSLKRS